MTRHGDSNVNVQLQIPLDPLVYAEDVVRCTIEILAEVVLHISFLLRDEGHTRTSKKMMNPTTAVSRPPR